MCSGKVNHFRRTVPVLDRTTLDSTITRPWYGLVHVRCSTVRVRFGFGDLFSESALRK